MRLVIPMAALLLFTHALLAQETLTRSLNSANGTFIGFLEFRPGDYDSQAQHPLIIFLSGYGEKGNGKGDLRLLHCCGLPSYIRRGHNMEFSWNGKRESFVVLMPQLSPAYDFWQSFYIDELIDYAKKNLNIDPDRIFLTGLSLGGGGTWAYASESQANAQKLAGIVPVVGPCLMSNGCNIARANLPVLAIHSVDDITVPPECTTDAIKSIVECDAASIPSLIMYPNGGHAVWLRRAYSTDHEYQNPNIYEWMLAQNKKLPPNKKPVADAGDNITLNGTSIAEVNAERSTDADGNVLLYRWRKLSGPAGQGVVESKNAIAAIERLNKAGTYRYELKVVDDRAEWDLDTITITSLTDVADTTTGGGEQGPVAIAGNDTSIISAYNEFLLNGTSSYDPDGLRLTYKWTKIEGEDADILYPDDAVTKVLVNNSGNYSFELEVKNENDEADKDTIEVRFTKEEMENGVMLYPNPVGSTARLQVNNDEEGIFNIAVYDMTGRVVIKKTFVKNQFSSFIIIDTHQLQPGVYTLQLTGTDKPVRLMLVKRR